MTQAFSDRLNEKRGIQTWLFVVLDLLISIPEQALEATLMIRKWPAVVAAVATALILASMIVGGGSGFAAVLIGFGVFIGVFALLSFWTMKRSRRATEFSYGNAVPKTWTWWTVLTVILALTYVVAGTGQLISDPKDTNVGALGIAVAFAVLMGVGLKLRSRSQTAGNFMVAAGAVPSLAFFWMILPPLVGISIIVGAVAEVSEQPPQVPLTT